LKKLLFLVILLLLYSVNLSYATQIVSDSFDDESKIAGYDRLYINTTGGYVRLSTTAENPYPNTTHIIAWWHFDEGSGQITVDSSGNGYDLTLGNSSVGDDYEPQWVNGVFNKALLFDGNDDYLTRSNIEILDNFTIEVWVEFNNLSGEQRFIFNDFLGNEYGLFKYGTADVLAMGVTLETSGWTPVIGSTTLETGKRYYFVGTYSSAEGLKIYINGSFEKDHSANEHLKSAGSNPLYIGCGDFWGRDYFVNGMIDEMRIWSRALNTTEISENSKIYRSQGVLYSKNLLSGLNVTEIYEFTYNCSIPSGASLKIQFSQDNSTWFSPTGVNEVVVMQNGTHTINLKTLGWKGGFFYYRVFFTRSDSDKTPKLYSISLTYSTSTSMSRMLSLSLITLFLLIPLMIIIFARRRRK